MRSLSLSFRLSRVRSPLGVLLVASDAEDCLRVLDFEDREARMRRLLHTQYRGHCDALLPGIAPRAVTDALEAFFAGRIDVLDAIPVRTGGTPFQRRVWTALRSIPAGTTTSYGALAAKIGSPAACRAVGLANGANPIGIVVPCHRVVGASGALTGYGGGIERKRWLLEHERAHCAASRRAS